MRDDLNASYAVILGAGPYGLSLAAHFCEAGIPFRIFGRPMHTWKTQMPVGMKLKSNGVASSISAGSKSFTLAEWSRQHGREYHDTLVPVPLEDFIAYGEEFARRFVPDLEQHDVQSVEREGDGFRVQVDTGEVLHTRQVIFAMGVGHFQYKPEFLAHLSDEFVSHTSEHRTFEQFAGKPVTVLGRGASALNAAVLLAESGADVTLVSRSRKIHIHHSTSTERSLYQKLRRPFSPLGVGIRSWLACTLPDLYRVLPGAIRRIIVFKHLGPAGGTALQGRVEGQFPMLLGYSIHSAKTISGAGGTAIKLTLAGSSGEQREHVTGHIIAGTGYKIDLARLPFLAKSVRDGIRREKNGAPTLDRHFECSVRGLYFVGPASAACFGPLQRFAAGAEYAAGRVTAHVRGKLLRASARNDSTVALPSATQH